MSEKEAFDIILRQIRQLQCASAPEQADLNTILKELRELKRMLKEDLAVDEEDLAIDQSDLAMGRTIHHTTQALEEGNKRIEEKTSLAIANLTGLHYVSLDLWRRMVWENCDARRSKPSDTEITYTCAVYGGPCRFEICPKNMSKKK